MSATPLPCTADWQWRVVVCTKGPVGNGATGPMSVTLLDDGVFNQHTFADTPWNGMDTLTFPVSSSYVNSSAFGNGTISNAKVMLNPGGPDFVNVSTSFNVTFANGGDSYATCGDINLTFSLFDQRDLSISNDGCG